MIMNKTIMKCMVLGLLFAGCENGDKEFDDYEYQTIIRKHCHLRERSRQRRRTRIANQTNFDDEKD